MKVASASSNIGFKLMLYVVESVTLFFVFYFVLMNMQRDTKQKEFDVLKNAIAKASVECYAEEGMYPPNIDYLEDNYGVEIDNTKYNVFYAGFASNVQPDITIVPVDIDNMLDEVDNKAKEGLNEG